METFTYDEVIELMSNCLLSYNVDDVYDEISIDFKTRLDALVTYKSKQL